MKIVSDFDGTLDKVLPLIKKLDGELIILTGRPPSERHKVEKLLKEKGVKYGKLINYPKEYTGDTGKDLKKITKFKAHKLLEMKADIFIDDDLKYVVYAKRKNPKLVCLIVV